VHVTRTSWQQPVRKSTDLFRQIFLFALAGVIGLGVDIAVLYVLRDAIGPFYGRAVSFFAAVLATWLVNRTLTFKGRLSGLSKKSEFTAYLSLMLIGGAVNYAIYSVLVVGVDTVREHLFLGVAAGSLAGMFVNFLTSKYLLFRRR
jgi:Predicted membrane protein